MAVNLLTTYEFKPVKGTALRLSKNAVFLQEPYQVKSHFTNLHWVEVNKENSLFLLKNFLDRKPIVKIAEEIQKEYPLNLVAGINICNFYLSDYGKEPLISSYNLFVSGGRIWQFPSVQRTILAERSGRLTMEYLKPKGKLKIGEKLFNWVSSLSLKRSPFVSDTNRPLAVIHGVFDTKFQYLSNDKLRRAKKPISSTLWVKNRGNKILLGVKPGNQFRPKVVKKTTKQLNLLKYLFVIELDQPLGNKISLGEEINQVEVDGYRIEEKDNVASLAFSLPKDHTILEKSVTQELINKNGKSIKVLDPRFRKAWSAILFTSKKVIFFLADAYPYKRGQEGLNIYELQELLSEKFNFDQCGICDGGQTSKLWVSTPLGIKIFGNLHYVNYSLKPPRRDGINGRPVPSTLFSFSVT
jgi:hypothetical protein